MQRRSTEGYKARHDYICMACGQPANEAHHMIPLSKGGEDSEENVILLCQSCHAGRLHKSYQDYLTALAALKFYAESKIMGTLPVILEKKKVSPTRPTNGVTPKFECPCGCGLPVSGRKGKKFASRECKDRFWNNRRLLAERTLIRLATTILEQRGYRVVKDHE